jgi:hypothetical protein
MQVVYADGGPLRNVNLYTGGINSDMLIPTTGLGLMSWAPPYIGGPTHFSVNGVDGQLPLPGFGDDFFINGTLVSGIPGTSVAGNAWIGMIGPGVPGSTVQYDLVNADIAGMLAVGAVGLDFSTVGAAGTWDCIAHTFGGMSFPVPEPAILPAAVAVAALAWHRRRVPVVARVVC